MIFCPRIFPLFLTYLIISEVRALRIWFENQLIKKLHDIHDDVLFKEWTELLFEQALLAEGTQLDNPAQFVKRVNHLLLS